MKKLSHLELTPGELSTEGVKELAAIKNLRTFALVLKFGAADGRVPPLTALDNLTSINLSHSQLSAAGLKAAGPAQNLTSLNLSVTNVTDAGLPTVAALENLSELDLSNASVTDAGLKHLGGARSFPPSLWGTRRWPAAGMRHLAAAPNLRTLDLTNIAGSRSGQLKGLAELKGLTTLTVAFSDEQAEEIAGAHEPHHPPHPRVPDGRRAAPTVRD